MNLCIVGNSNTTQYKKLIDGILNSNLDIKIVPKVSEANFALALNDTLSLLLNNISIYYPDLNFINKIGLEQKCIASNIPILPTLSFSLENLRTCTYDFFIVKPKEGSGGKDTRPYVYKIFANSDIESVISMVGDTFDDRLFIQQALINKDTQETYLLFVDGTINGQGNIHFNSIAEKWMLNAANIDSNITHKFGIRLVSDEDKFGLKEKITKLVQDNNIHNTLFKTQAIVDLKNNTCYLNDWSWSPMPYTHLNILPIEYLVNHLEYAYDIIPEVTKPIDKIIVMYHISFPKEVFKYNNDQFMQIYSELMTTSGVKQAESLDLAKSYSAVPTISDYYVLFGTTCDTVEEGKQKLEAFQALVNEQGIL